VEDRTPGDIHQALVAAMPNLRAFAISLCGDVTMANDLVQETVMKAWANRDKFIPDTNFKAWLFTILRNTYFSGLRRSRREIQDVDGQHAALMSSPPEQNGHLDLKDFARALEQVSPDQREALILVGAEGFSYEEAAAVCGCAVGTIKSRVNRARNRIAEIMAVTSIHDIEFDPSQSAVAVPARGSLD
jgi:RNA polymerase sigma-70 factor, ECF subfamily